MIKRISFSSLSFFVASAVFFVSCGKESVGDEFSSVRSDGKVEVVLPVDRSGGVAASGVATRTALGADGLSVEWCVGDEVALWADAVDDGAATLVGEKFTMRYFSTNYTDAEFSATIDPMDDSKSYTYRGFYPYPTSISGKVATFEIPSVQSGQYDGLLDFRVSDTQEGVALSGSTLGGCELKFRSLMHAFKISVPEVVGEAPRTVKGFFVTMPCDIVGVSEFDMSNVDGDPQLVSGSSDVVYVSFEDSPITSGDGKSVWMFFNPVSNVTGNIVIEAVCESGNMTEGYSIPITDHTFAAGRITPLGAELGDELAPLQELKFNVNSTQLGETVNSLTLTAPSGSVFFESGKNVLTLTPDSDGNCGATFRDDYTEKFKSGATTIAYESKSAKVSGSINITGSMDTELVVPYLYAEDFSSVKSFNSNDNGGVTSSSTGTTAFTFTESTNGLTGWSAARAGAGAGLSVRICARYEYKTTNSWGTLSSAASTYDARIDSPTLSNLKSGSNVKVKVSFDYKGGEQAQRRTVSKSGFLGTSTSYGSFLNTDLGDPTFIYGYTTDTGAQAYNSSIENEAISAYKTISVSSNGDPGYGSVSTYIDPFYIESATSATRLSWKASQNCSVSGNYDYYGNYWLYIDNIRVSIVTE